MMVDAFLPSNLASVTISVGAAATSTLLPVGTVPGLNPWRSGGEFLEVNNAGAVDVFIETSDGSVVATVAASYPVRAGQCKIIRRAQGDRFISAIGAAAGPTNLIVTVGNGI
jgi:hypothetical protein